ncbi:MAG: glycogen synthase GlgA [Rhizobiales bacterium]|nr:glycogen synthase GlgA [Hyphomicrobiales bacterium]
MKVLSVASEMHPVIKTGGLADVTGALPGALAPYGVDVTTVLPAYGCLDETLLNGKPVATFEDVLGHKVQITRHDGGGAPLLLVHEQSLFDRAGGPYVDDTGFDFVDNWRRFAVFSKAAALIAAGGVAGFQPDLMHVHDWQAALAVTYLKNGPKAALPAVATIHNIAFKGQFGGDIFANLDLPARVWHDGEIEYYGDVSYLKAGLTAADAITTVSPGYADEIQTPAFGMGFEGLMTARRSVLHGIVNGVDDAIWNPVSDHYLIARYDAKSLAERAANRAAVIQRFHLIDNGAPLVVVISRLTPQKGIDILIQSLDELVGLGFAFAILGVGDPAYMNQLGDAASRHPGRVALIVGHDEILSHRMQGGGDMILIPSRFEPCGLTQLYGMRYGCVPVVTATGGLGDTVIDASLAATRAGVATGFHLKQAERGELIRTMTRAMALFRDRRRWQKIQQNGMKANVSWKASAADYSALFKTLISRGKTA